MYSERIKQIRQTLDLSVAKLSKKIEIPDRTIASYEGGRVPSLDFLARLCTTLNIDANWFITGEGEMFKPTKYEGKASEINYNSLETKLEELLRKHKLID